MSRPSPNLTKSAASSHTLPDIRALKLGVHTSTRLRHYSPCLFYGGLHTVPIRCIFSTDKAPISIEVVVAIIDKVIPRKASMKRHS